MLYFYNLNNYGHRIEHLTVSIGCDYIANKNIDVLV